MASLNMFLFNAKPGSPIANLLIPARLPHHTSKEANDQLVALLTSPVPPEKREELKNIRKVIADRHSGRLTWVFFIAVSMLFCIGALAVSIVLINKSSGFMKEKASSRVSTLIGLSFLLGIVLWALPNSFTPVMGEVLRSTISQGRGGMPIVFDVMRFINAFTYVASFSLIFASCSILLPQEDVPTNHPTNGNITPSEQPENEANKDEAEPSNRLGPIADQMKAIRMFLYVGTLLLIVGILRMSAVTQWSLAFIQPDATDGAKAFYATLITVTGGFYTLILAALYLPAMFILQRRAQALEQESPPLSDEEKGTLDSPGFTSPLKKLYRESLLSWDLYWQGQ